MKILVLASALALATAPAGLRRVEARSAAAADVQNPAGLSFTATLDSIKINGRPNQVVTRQFSLTLDEHQPVTRFKAHVEDWWRSEDGKQSFYAAPGTLKQSCANWVSLNPVDSVVKAGETMTVRVTVAVPGERLPGGYWCALTVDEVPDPLAASAGIGVKFIASVSTGIFVYLDPVTRNAEIVDLQIRADESLIKVRNLGNAPLGIEGRIEFFNGSADQPVAVTTLARTTVLTAPSPAGVIETALPSADSLPTGRYRVRAVLDFGGDHYIGAEREIDVAREVPQHVLQR